MTSASEILREARRLLEPPGAWVQGTGGYEKEGTCCLGTAVVRASKYDPLAERHLAIAALRREIAALTGADYDHAVIVDWNDYVSRTKVQVLALVDAAVKREEEEI